MKEKINYQLTNIPKEFWIKVKIEATKHGLSIKDFILKILSEKIGCDDE